MKLDGSVELTYVNVILKFGYDEINFSYKNGLLKNLSNLCKFGGHKKAKFKDLVFTLNATISV